MLKYIHSEYVKRNLAGSLETQLMKVEYLKKSKVDIDMEIYSKILEASKDYSDYKLIFSSLNHNLKITELQAEINKLKNELDRNEYLNSFLNASNQFAFLRKSINLILDKIIKENYQKLKFVKPSLKLVNLTLEYITNIQNRLSIFSDNRVAKSIMNKMNNVISVLDKYKNSLEKKKEKEIIKVLNFPIIILSDEEKKFLNANLNKENEWNKIKIITVSNDEDSNLDFIINYCFELNTKINKALHINDKEDLKYFSFCKDREDLPEPNKDDNIKSAIDKIKLMIEMIPKQDKITYAQLIDYLFDSKKKIFFRIDNKISYLLTFLNLKLEKMNQIKDQYEKIKENVKQYLVNIRKKISEIKIKSNKLKYDKFINKYEIKINKKEIFEYLNYLVSYIIPENSKNEINNSKKDEFYSVIVEEEEKFKQKEKELRNNIIQLFENDPKFINYITNYLMTKLVEYINNDEISFNKKFNFLVKNNLEKTLLCLKLNEIENVILSFKLFNFDINKHYTEFVKNYDEIIPTKKVKIKDDKEVVKSITNYQTFIEKLKEYIGNIEETVAITDEEPGQFVFNLFLKQIGFGCF